MRTIIKTYFLIFFGWFFVLLGAIGAMLPLLPTTPFLIVALGLFAKSSPKFHQMLISNRYFGPALKQWEESKTLSRNIKRKASFLIILTFSLSITLLWGTTHLQIMLLCIATLLLTYIWKLKEEPSGSVE